jgi:hypothetical protein
MSNTIKTRLETVSSNLDTAINKANNLPDAGSGSGGSIETCTVEFSPAWPGSIVYFTTLDEEGALYTESQIASGPTPMLSTQICQNVVCGSNIIWAKHESPATVVPALNTITINGTAKARYTNEQDICIFEAPEIAGEVCIIDV